MKKNILLLACAVLMILSPAFAANVTVQDAQTVAVNFFKIKLGNNAPRTITATLQYTRTETDNTVDFYAFNMAPAKGFVIISATDNDQPVIGYSTESAFQTDFSKIGLNEWLNRWSEELHYVALHNVIATPKAAPLWTAYRQGITPTSEKVTSVAPFCQTTWSQENDYGSGPNLYNNYCPGGTGANQAVTGCVATAMAQIMKYWNYPTKGTGSSSYSDETSQGFSENYGTLSFNYGTTTFDWTNMVVPMLTTTSTTTQIDAIGTLMYAAGVSVDMDYDPNGSGAAVLQVEAGGSTAPCAQYSYVHYFGYQSIIQGILLTGAGVTSGGISSAAFTDSLEADLNIGRLVQVQGTDKTEGGHTWVCDGYETSPSTMFHMNWGWSGYSDGYFALTNMDPNDGEALDFSEDIGALIHILPPVQPSGTTITELASVLTNAVCAGTQTQLNATTHTGATYSWVPTTGLSSSTIANPVATPLTTTIYTVTADSAGITASSNVTITVHPVPSATVSSSNAATCFGSSNGSITANISGGTAGYTYLWSNGETTAIAGNLAQGTYKLTVTDSKSCSATMQGTVTQPQALSISANPANATCGQANGSITATVGGGTSGYTYHWSNSDNTATATGLSAGSYEVTVTDAHSCSITTSASITSSGTLNLVTNGANATCYGSATGSASASVTGNTGSVTYQWSNGANTSSIQNVGAATYVVTITDGSGCSATSSKVVSQPAAINPVVTAASAGCGTSNGSATASVTGGTGAYSYLWSTGATGSSITSLPAGNYNLSVTDANHCSVTATAVVASGSSLSAAVTATSATCYGDNNGSGQITMNSGSGVSPYSYNWSNGATSSAVINLPAGSYSVTITDANHCTTSGNISVTQPDQIQFATNSNSATENQENGSAGIGTIVGGTAPYDYHWSTGSTAQSITNIAGGTYRVTVTDANGCSQTATDVVSVKTSTGINAVNSEIAFSIYPNPAHTQVLVEVDQLGNSTTLNLRNILGQDLISQVISNTQTQIDLTSLANGVYLVELRQGEKMAVKQLVIAK